MTETVGIQPILSGQAYRGYGTARPDPHELSLAATAADRHSKRLRHRSLRGFGANQLCFALESNLDEITRRLELDPFEIRLRHALDTVLPTAADHLLAGSRSPTVDRPSWPGASVSRRA
jgi:hypothetical protein